MKQTISQWSSLLPEERERLTVLEGIVKSGLDTFMDVGRALLEIRDKRLYRNTHLTFESYCRDRWGMSQPYAQRHINAARVVEAMPIGIEPPANEAQARELAPLLNDEDKLREVWGELVEENGRTVTAKQIREAVRDVEEFSPDAEGVCPTCHGTGRIPIEELGGKVK